MPYEIDALPYDYDALQPAISARTLRCHYDKHHCGYVDKLNRAMEGSSAPDPTLEELVRTSEGDLYNNAAQVWNHSFYWKGMAPTGGGKPEGMLLDVLTNEFTSFEQFKQDFAEAANGEFGSGWAWLVRDKYGRLKIQKSSDAENPMQQEFTPMLTLDVWEHAYYLDYQNERNRYVQSFLDDLVDWAHVAAQLDLPGSS